jgi:hypothetical protein
MNEATAKAVTRPADTADLVDPDEANGEVRFVFTPEARAVLDDRAWVNDRLTAGAWAGYAGHYIAVCDRRFLGHGPDMTRLRDETARDHGLPPGRIVVKFIDPPIEG